ncbi:MAG: RNA polymerase sigma factor [Deltaproteobacteria bacterium]|nr:MAG: RNA polymerase sigma factor [Deltaproteobacteria bacterium]
MAERFTTQDLEQFLATCEPYLRRTCRRLARNDALGDDLCHDVWIAVKKAAPQFRGDCAPVTFVYRIALNKIADWRKRAPQRRNVPLDSDVQAGLVAPQTASSVRRMRHDFRQLELSDDEEVALALVGQGRSLKEIADIFQVSEEAMKKRHQRAMERARALAAELSDSSS